MAPKRAAAREATPSAATTVPGTPAPVTATTPSKTGRTALNDKSTIFQIVESVWHHYIDTTPQRTFLIDAFLGFLVVLGIVQFLYCILAGNYVCCSLRSLEICCLGLVFWHRGTGKG
jgi:oligosaccharyltransferase complex subunit epsilon